MSFDILATFTTRYTTTLCSLIKDFRITFNAVVMNGPIA
jgi:hypothetical protein